SEDLASDDSVSESGCGGAAALLSETVVSEAFSEAFSETWVASRSIVGGSRFALPASGEGAASCSTSSALPAVPWLMGLQYIPESAGSLTPIRAVTHAPMPRIGHFRPARPRTEPEPHPLRGGSRRHWPKCNIVAPRARRFRPRPPLPPPGKRAR